MDELSKANNDMKNLLASTEIATIFLNRDKTIKNFTPATKDIINIIERDAGRPVGDLTAKLDYPGLVEDVSEVLDKQTRKERTVRHRNGRWYIARIMPYLTVDNEKAGAILTFVDITALRQAEDKLRDAIIDQALLQVVTDPLLILNGELHVIKANEAFYKTFKTKPAETEKTLLYDLGNGQWDIPELKDLLNRILTKNTSLEDYPVEHKFPQLGRKKMLLDARRVFHDENKTELILLRIRDVTE